MAVPAATTEPAMSKRVLITGCSSGIGRALARKLSADGHQVVATARRLSSLGGLEVARRLELDVTSDESVASAVAAAGDVDVLVNNAGILKTVPLADTSDELFARTFAINVQGSFNTMREAATRLNDDGSIVNFSTSVVGLKPPGYAIYGATKAAVETMSQIFAKELRGRRIRVNVVAPGPVATELFFDGKTPEQIAHFAGLPPLERLGEPEDIARVVSFLAGPEAGWVNGQVLRANGGVV